MPAFDDDRARAELQNFFSGLANRGVGVDFHVSQPFSLGNIGRDDGSERNQPLANRAFTFRANQSRPGA